MSKLSLPAGLQQDPPQRSHFGRHLQKGPASPRVSKTGCTGETAAGTDLALQIELQRPLAALQKGQLSCLCTMPSQMHNRAQRQLQRPARNGRPAGDWLCATVKRSSSALRSTSASMNRLRASVQVEARTKQALQWCARHVYGLQMRRPHRLLDAFLHIRAAN